MQRLTLYRSNSSKAPKTPNPKWDFFATLRVKEKLNNRLLQFRVMEAKFLAKDEPIGNSISTGVFILIHSA